MTAKEISYDPVKAALGRLVSRRAWLRRLFFMTLGALFLREWHVRKALRELARLRSSWEILDAGSGYGQYAHFMARQFPNAKVLGIDVKKEQIDDSNWFASKVGQMNCLFDYADLTEFCQPDTFHLALSVDVMEHVEEDEKVFANLRDSLRENGFFLVATPSTSQPSDMEGHEFHSVVGEHVREGYAESELRRKLEGVGFRILWMKRTYGPWGNIAWHLLQRFPMRLLDISKIFAVLILPYYLLVYLPAAFCMAMDVRVHNTHGGGWLVLVQK